MDHDENAEPERRSGGDRRSGDERREEAERRSGGDRRGSGLKTRRCPATAYPFHFRSIDDRRSAEDRRLTTERRFGYAGSPTLLTAEELAALLTPSDD